jgi:putative membrane protein
MSSSDVSEGVVSTSSTTEGGSTAEGGPISDAGWTTSEMRRLHPLTPLFRSWQLVGAVGAAGIGAFRDELDKLMWIWRALHGDAEYSVLARALGILFLVALGSIFVSWLAWRATGFALLQDDSSSGRLVFHRGLFIRQRSSVRLNRVQSVDVNAPFIPRLFGLAAVRLDMAAGDDASVNLAYLTRRDAEALRLEILRHTSAAQAPTDASRLVAPPTPDQLVAVVSTTQLVKANLLDGFGAWLLFAAWLLLLVAGGILLGWTVFVAGLAGIIPVTIALGVQLRRQVSSMLRDADFRLWRTPTGIRLSSGLTSTINRTIDFDRIQGVRLEQPLLWRRLGWVRVEADVAGADSDGSGGVRLMPVTTPGKALRLVEEVTGEQLGELTVAPPGRGARLLDPLGFDFMGVLLLESGAVTRWGRWRRTSFFVPYARVQSVSVRQGWVQRRRAVATVYLDPPKGGQRWEGRHRDVAEAADLVEALALRARASRVSRGSPKNEPLPKASR